MTQIRLAIALGLTCAAWAAVEPAPRVWEGSIALPTWEEGPADPIPHFAALSADRAWYPYPVRALLGNQNRKQAWRTLNLENEYLTCIVLPDLGGHLYSCRDKLSGYEMFHANPSIKKAMIGLRGAWAALGVELNFPVGHSLLTVSPVDFRTSQTADSASVWVGATDRVTGMRWRVEFTLERGAAVLRQSVRLENPTTVRRRYYWWTNASVTLGDDTRFVVPTKLIAGHGRAQIDKWPVGTSGLDRSAPANYPSSVGWFAYETREPFLAVYHARSQTGTLHYADPIEMPGKKIWTWGRDEDRQMRAALSDDNSQYVEIQAGLFANQETYGILEPGASRAFTEYWIPVRKLEGISQANRDGVVHLARKGGVLQGGVLQVQLMATRAIAGAKARILCGGKVLVDEAVVVDPAKPWTRSIAGAPAGVCTFQLLDAAGKSLLEYAEGETRASGAESVKLGAQTAAAAGPPSLESGTNFELQGDLRRASEDYGKALAQTPANSALRKAAGRLAAVMQRFEESAALLLPAADAEAHYYRGVALAGLGKDEDARREWTAARADAHFGAASGMEIAAAMARAGEVQRAANALAGVGTQTVHALVMQAALAREAGSAAAESPLAPGGAARAREGVAQAQAARARGDVAGNAAAKIAVAKAAALDATDSAVRFEQVRQGGSDPTLWEHLAADPERVLEIAELYMHWGRYRDALEVLMYRYQPVSAMRREPGAAMPQDDALVAYYRGYCHQKLDEYSAEDFRTGSSLPVRYDFPSRAGERRVLEEALKMNGGDANAHYLLGLWLLNAQMILEGSRELQTAHKLRPDLAEVRALLATLKLPVQPMPVTARPAVPAPAPVPVSAPRVESLAMPSMPSMPSMASVPGWFTGKPRDVANAALDAAAAGNLDQAAGYFIRANFPEGKQDDAIRAAYIEVQLQRLRATADAGQCAAADRGITTLGYEDKSLPFTFTGFGAFVKTARFQYQLGLVEAACVDEKEARKRWEKVSKMRAGIASPDFAYSYMALAKLGPVGGLGIVVQQVEAGLAAARPEDLPGLLYNKGLLLLVLGNKADAEAAFRQGAAKAPAGMLRYLNSKALRAIARKE